MSPLIDSSEFVFIVVAFDPAQPGFEANPDEVRLVKSDAEFVDVIHTNSRPVIPLLGFGLILPTGKIFYIRTYYENK